MPNLLTQHRVQNYDAWRPHFDRHEETRKAHGITNPRVYRNANDPDDLVLLFDVADIERAKEFGEFAGLALDDGKGRSDHARHRARSALKDPASD